MVPLPTWRDRHYFVFSDIMLYIMKRVKSGELQIRWTEIHALGLRNEANNFVIIQLYPKHYLFNSSQKLQSPTQLMSSLQNSDETNTPSRLFTIQLLMILLVPTIPKYTYTLKNLSQYRVSGILVDGNYPINFDLAHHTGYSRQSKLGPLYIKLKICKMWVHVTWNMHFFYWHALQALCFVCIENWILVWHDITSSRFCRTQSDSERLFLFRSTKP